MFKLLAVPSLLPFFGRTEQPSALAYLGLCYPRAVSNQVPYDFKKYISELLVTYASRNVLGARGDAGDILEADNLSRDRWRRPIRMEASIASGIHGRRYQ